MLPKASIVKYDSLPPLLFYLILYPLVICPITLKSSGLTICTTGGLRSNNLSKDTFRTGNIARGLGSYGIISHLCNNKIHCNIVSLSFTYSLSNIPVLIGLRVIIGCINFRLFYVYSR